MINVRHPLPELSIPHFNKTVYIDGRNGRTLAPTERAYIEQEVIKFFTPAQRKFIKKKFWSVTAKENAKELLELAPKRKFSIDDVELSFVLCSDRDITLATSLF